MYEYSQIVENTETIISNQETYISNQEDIKNINQTILFALVILFLYIFLKESFKGRLP